MGERVQKYLARAGFGSRRQIEKWLQAGRISNEHGLMKLGDRVGVADVLYFKGKKVIVSTDTRAIRMLAYHKAEGEICTHNDPGGRRLVQQSLPKIEHGRWLSVGRLDINTTGLLLFSNDGALVHSLMHPSSEIEREYVCRVFGAVSDEVLARLLSGVHCGNALLKFKKVERLDRKHSGRNHWYRIVLSGGKNREIRRAWQICGCEVNRLKRVRYGFFWLPRDLEIGRWVELDSAQIDQFRNLCQ